MTSLTERQQDALAELINIAFGRTAASLSDLVGHRVVLEAPQVAIYPMEEMFEVLSKLTSGDLATVHQIFTGPVAGDAFLVLDYKGAMHLVDLFVDDYTPTQRFDASAREVLTEVGNILLNACLGMFGEILEVRISFAVPRLRLEELDSLITSLMVGKDELRYALIIYTGFRMRDDSLRGYLVVVMGVTSLDRLLQAVDEWEKSQTE